MENINSLIRNSFNAKSLNFKKGEVLQQIGDTKAQTYFVKKGLLRSYIIDSKGKEHIFNFAPEDWIIADIEALEFNEPTTLCIDCLEDTEVLVFDKDCLFKADLDKKEIIGNSRLLYRRIARLQRRVLMLMGSPAIDRYAYFINTYPELPNRIPQHMIATYLGIMPQTLSTIKKEYIKTNL